MEKWQKDDQRRQATVQKAKEAALICIMDGSDGSPEETNKLTADVAPQLLQIAMLPFSATLMKYDGNQKKTNE